MMRRKLRSFFSLGILIALLHIPFSALAVLTLSGGSWSSHRLGATVTDPDITISGTFTVDVNATFENCPNIKMAKDARIVVNDRVTFTINGSRLYTAGPADMWKGIQMLGTPVSGGFIRMSRTTVEDAVEAISGIWPPHGMMANYSFDLEYVKFNRNLKGITKKSFASETDMRVAPTLGFYSGATHRIHGFWITCVDDVSSGRPVPVNLKSGTLKKPEYGMHFARLGKLQISGQPHPGAFYGVCQYLNTGIIVQNCEMDMRHCIFSDIKAYDAGPGTWAAINGVMGSGIFSTNNITFNPGISFIPRMDISMSTFRDCEWGMSASIAPRLTFDRCFWERCGIVLEYAGNRNKLLQLSNSEIKDCDNGILMYNNTGTTTRITGNTININFPEQLTEPSVYPYVSAFSADHKAISIIPVSPALTGSILVANNIITGGDVGIELNMTEGAVVKNNTLYFSPYRLRRPPLWGRLGTTRYGIHVFGGQGNDISENSVRGTAGDYRPGLVTPVFFNTTYEEQYGIAAVNSPANQVSCNNTGDLYSAFLFEGNNLNTRFSTNNFDAGRRFVTGVYLQEWASGGAIISQQGVRGGDPHFNTFNGNFNYPGGYKTICDGMTDGSRSPFLYASGTPVTPSPNFGTFAPIRVLGTASATVTPVPCVPPLRLTGGGNTGSPAEPVDQSSLDWALAIAADNLYHDEDFADFLRFESVKFLYAYLDERPLLRDRYPEFAAFYREQQLSEIGLLYEADVLLRQLSADGSGSGVPDAGLISRAIARLSAIPANTPFAGLEAEVRILLLEQLLSDTGYEQPERERLETIAALCPGREGMGVYMARNLVRSWKGTVLYEDACMGNGTALLRQAATQPGGGDGPASLPHRLLPNPLNAGSNAQLLLSQAQEQEDELKLYDAYGRQVRSIMLPAGSLQLELNTAGLAAGMYLYTNRDARVRGKLLIR